LIDVAAIFSKESSEQVIKSILKNNKQFNYGLFINNENITSLIINDENIDNNKSTRYQDNLTHDQLKNTFTYFDQGHIVGVDLILYNKAKGLVTINNKCIYSSTTQGIYRLRSINKGQTIDIYCDKSYASSKYEVIDKLIKEEISYQNNNYNFFITQCAKTYLANYDKKNYGYDFKIEGKSININQETQIEKDQEKEKENEKENEKEILIDSFDDNINFITCRAYNIVKSTRSKSLNGISTINTNITTFNPYAFINKSSSKFNYCFLFQNNVSGIFNIYLVPYNEVIKILSTDSYSNFINAINNNNNNNDDNNNNSQLISNYNNEIINNENINSNLDEYKFQRFIAHMLNYRLNKIEPSDKELLKFGKDYIKKELHDTTNRYITYIKNTLNVAKYYDSE